MSEASSSILGRTAVTNARFEVEKFDGTGHFGMWQGEVLDVLFQQGLDIAIEEKKQMVQRKPSGQISTAWVVVQFVRVCQENRSMHS